MRDTELFDVPLPANLQAERVVLGAILLNNAVFTQVRDSLDPDDFSLEKHKRIFLRMGELYERSEQIDRITVYNELIKAGQREEEILSYLADLTEHLPELPDVESYERILQDKSILRRAALYCSKVLREALSTGGDSASVIGRLQALTEALQQCIKSDDTETAEKVITQIGLDILLGGVKRSLVSSPWPRLNQIIGGFEPGQMVCIGARPSMGKTVMACQIALSAAEAGKTAAVFSLEMNNIAILQRLISSLSGIPHHRVRSGELQLQEREQVQAAVLHLTEIHPLYMAERSYTIPAIRAQLAKIARRQKVDLVVIDYLQLISTLSTRNRVEQITEISRGVKMLAQQFDCALIVASQLSRESEKEQREPRLSDLRDSGSIEQDSDLVIFPHRVPGQEADEANVRGEFIVAKQRNGRLGRVPVVFEKPFVRFVEA